MDYLVKYRPGDYSIQKLYDVVDIERVIYPQYPENVDTIDCFCHSFLTPILRAPMTYDDDEWRKLIELWNTGEYIVFEDSFIQEISWE